jgi:hypothetical protein
MEGNILTYVRLKYPEISDSKVIEYGQYENLNLYWRFDNGKTITESPLSLIDDIFGLILKKEIK